MPAATRQGLRIWLLGCDEIGGCAKGEAKNVIPVVVERMLGWIMNKNQKTTPIFFRWNWLNPATALSLRAQPHSRSLPVLSLSLSSLCVSCRGSLYKSQQGMVSGAMPTTATTQNGHLHLLLFHKVDGRGLGWN